MKRKARLKFTPGPYHVEPDVPSHGSCLCIVAGHRVIARTPVTRGYNCKEQARVDFPNAALLARAPVMHALLARIEKLARSQYQRRAPAGSDLLDQIADIAVYGRDLKGSA